jgi:hypothetical protein
MKFIQILKTRFGNVKITEGDKCQYLGMVLQIDRNLRCINMSIAHGVKSLLEFAGIQGNEKRATPCLENLFKVDSNSIPMEEKEKDKFHSTVAKCLYISQHGRPDINLTVSFLASRVHNPTMQDGEKLKHLLWYLNGSRDESINIGCTNPKIIDVSIDSSYAPHPDAKSHTGMTITLGTGLTDYASQKQKIVTKSSGEAEFVGLSLKLGQAIWIKRVWAYITNQNPDEIITILRHDNLASKRLMEEGRALSQRTKHMHVKYFWIKEAILNEKIVIKYQKSAEMLADFFAKPNNGVQFKKFRNLAMGHQKIF